VLKIQSSSFSCNVYALFFVMGGKTSVLPYLCLHKYLHNIFAKLHNGDSDTNINKGCVIRTVALTFTFKSI
jgi:hypothetical protein